MTLIPPLGGCFTGIESTKKITLSKEDRKAVAPTAEELFLSDVTASPHTEWAPGKRFVVVGTRGSVLFEPREIVSGNFSLSLGDTLFFVSDRIVTLPDGKRVSSIIFRRGSDIFSFVPQTQSRRGNVMSDAMPGIVDPAMVECVADRMVGKTFWTRSPLWMDEEGERVQGRKFEKVRILSVTPGDMIFPLRVGFEDEAGKRAYMLMNFGSEGTESRSFANLFQLEDPKRGYRDISDRYWENIRRGVVEVGMTKEECRLAKGNPTAVDASDGYSHALLIWGYPDGTALYFIDDVLKGINGVPDAD